MGNDQIDFRKLNILFKNNLLNELDFKKELDNL